MVGISCHPATSGQPCGSHQRRHCHLPLSPLSYAAATSSTAAPAAPAEVAGHAVLPPKITWPSFGMVSEGWRSPGGARGRSGYLVPSPAVGPARPTASLRWLACGCARVWSCCVPGNSTGSLSRPAGSFAHSVTVINMWICSTFWSGE